MKITQNHLINWVMEFGLEIRGQNLSLRSLASQLRVCWSLLVPIQQNHFLCCAHDWLRWRSVRCELSSGRNEASQWQWQRVRASERQGQMGLTCGKGGRRRQLGREKSWDARRGGIKTRRKSICAAAPSAACVYPARRRNRLTASAS